MKRYHNTVINDATGLPVASPTVTVYHDDGVTVAPIFSDEGITTKPNPFTGDSKGRLDFYAPDADYVVKGEAAGVTATQLSDVTIADEKRGGFGVSDDRVVSMANAFYLRRTAAFNRIDAAKPAWALELDSTANDYFRMLRAAAAANPITWTELLRVTAAGHLLFGTDNTQDIGASGATRPRDIYVGTSVRIGTTPPAAGTLRVDLGTITADTPILSAVGIWNAVAVAFTGIKANFTDTASAAASLLLDLQVGGVSKFKVDKFGLLTLPGYTLAGLPAAGTAGRLARVTDDVGGIRMDSGSAWGLISPTITYGWALTGDLTVRNFAATGAGPHRFGGAALAVTDFTLRGSTADANVNAIHIVNSAGTTLAAYRNDGNTTLRRDGEGVNLLDLVNQGMVGVPASRLSWFFLDSLSNLESFANIQVNAQVRTQGSEKGVWALAVYTAGVLAEAFRTEDGVFHVGPEPVVITGAGQGDIVLKNNKRYRGVNPGGTSAIALIYLDSFDVVAVGDNAHRIKLDVGSQDIQWGKPLVALGGGATPTFGTIGGSGPATAAQNTWMRVIDSGGVAFWVPAWK